jgi:cyclohexa-1,5-dienecarbonyl-CoA hydratase
MHEPPLPIRVTVDDDGALLRIVLARPKGNILDPAMVAAIRAAVAEHRLRPGLKSILFEGEGAHFSFGASVEAHLPGEIRGMLTGFHGLFRELAASGKVLIAAVRGQCLGGGLELAAFCHRVVASPEARLGNPEILLGVFAPLASAVLPHRIGQAAADDLLLTGRTIDAAEALSIRLVDEVATDPGEAALAWHHRFDRVSSSSLSHAVRAARDHFHGACFAALERVERRYLEERMTTADAVEGITAFLEKRAPRWTHR